jgi:hypothetical protein
VEVCLHFGGGVRINACVEYPESPVVIGQILSHVEAKQARNGQQICHIVGFHRRSDCLRKSMVLRFSQLHHLRQSGRSLNIKQCQYCSVRTYVLKFASMAVW